MTFVQTDNALKPGKLLLRHRPAESTDVFFVSLSNISQNMAACKHF